jgi:hypothetical protein
VACTEPEDHTPTTGYLDNKLAKGQMVLAGETIVPPAQ